MDKTYTFIVEQTSVNTPSDITILEESTTPQGKKKVIFGARLQEAEVVNSNKRRYPTPICEAIVEKLAPKARGRSLLCEIDHPMVVSNNPNVSKQRAAVVEIKNCGAAIRDIRFENGEIVAELETLSGFRGPDLAALISEDKVDIGFSLRAMGSLRRQPDGTFLVENPIVPITYDVVSNPSHQNAKILKFLPESAEEFVSDSSEVICEGEELELLNEERIQVCDGNSCVYRFIDDIINENFNQYIRKITFNI